MWYPVLISNILIDAAISVLFAPTVWSLQISQWQKVRISSLFGIRLLYVSLRYDRATADTPRVCGLTICQLATLAPALRAADTTRAMLVPTIFEQYATFEALVIFWLIMSRLVMNFSILTAAAPSLYRFLNELHSGPGFGGMLDRTQYELSQFTSSDERRKKPTGYIRKKSKADESRFRPDVDGKSYDVNVHENRKSLDVMSKSSGHGSEDMIIKQTTAWTVKTYNRGGDASAAPPRLEEAQT